MMKTAGIVLLVVLVGCGKPMPRMVIITVQITFPSGPGPESGLSFLERDTWIYLESYEHLGNGEVRFVGQVNRELKEENLPWHSTCFSSSRTSRVYLPAEVDENGRTHKLVGVEERGRASKP